MEDRKRIEEIVLKGTEDELSELRVWLFKESVRLENMESSLSERYERLEQAAMTEDAETAARLVAEAGWPNMAGMSVPQMERQTAEAAETPEISRSEYIQLLRAAKQLEAISEY